MKFGSGSHDFTPFCLTQYIYDWAVRLHTHPTFSSVQSFFSGSTVHFRQNRESHAAEHEPTAQNASGFLEIKRASYFLQTF